MSLDTSLRGEPQWLIDMRAKLADLDRRLAAHEELVRRELERVGVVGDWADDRLARYEGSE